MIKQYETVFIATPVLSETQMKEAVAKYVQLIADNGGEVVYQEDWGLSGFYYLIEFKANPEFIATLETQYHRDERIIRYITVALDKDAVAYAEHRRQNRAAKAAAPKVEEPKAEEPKAEPAAAEAAPEAPAADNAEVTVEA